MSETPNVDNLNPLPVIMMKTRLQAFIRSHGYAWPGGYPCILIMSDGECLCADCARANYRLIRQADKSQSRDGWCPDDLAIHWEGPAEQCAHCGTDIPSAYGDPDAPEEDAA